MNLCECGCRNRVSLNHRFISGHNSKINNPMKGKKGTLSPNFGKKHRKKHEERIGLNLCACNCGEYCVNRFVLGHNPRGNSTSKKQKEAARQFNLGKKRSEKTKKLMGRAKLGNKYGLGHKVSEEAKKKTGDINRGNKYRLGKKHSDEAKENMRAAAIKRLEEGTLGWPRGESYSEKVFREFLEYCGAINGIDFVQEYHIGIYWLDFAYLDEKHYIEIDGQQHLIPEAIEHDKKRDGWLESQGWIGIRLPAKGLKEFLYRRDGEIIQKVRFSGVL
ncbi:MAG: DUF559 domain-containing protein [Patescibacteria group bacterium]